MKNTSNQSGSNKESAESKKWNSEVIESRVYKNFIEENYRSQWVSFINTYSSMNQWNSVYREEIMNFIASHSEFNDLGDDFREKISLNRIQSQLAKYIILYKNERQNLKSRILDIYNIPNDVYRSVIAHQVETLEIDTIHDMLNDPSQLESLLKKAWIENPEYREMTNFLKDFNLNHAVAKIQPKERQEKIQNDIHYILNDRLNIHSPNFPMNFWTILNTLYSEWVLTGEEKKDFMNMVISFISLKDAQNIWIFDSKDISKYIRDVILEWVDEKHKNFLEQSLQSELGDIKVDTNYIKASSKNIDLLAQKYGFEEVWKRIQKNYVSRLEWEPNNISDLIEKMSQNFPGKIDWIEYFSTGSTLMIDIETPQKETETRYFHIASVSLPNAVNKNVISFESRWWNGKYYSQQHSAPEIKTYGEFLELLKKDSTKKMKFISEQSLENKIKNGKIEEDDGNYMYRTSRDIAWSDQVKRNDLIQKLIDAKEMSEGEDLDDKITQFSPEQKTKYIQELHSIDERNTSNIQHLLTNVNRIDKKWEKFGLQKWTTFSLLQWDMFTIESIVDDGIRWMIELSRIGWKREKIDFENFFKTFQDKRCSRWAFVESGLGLVTDVNRDEKLWDDITFENNQLHRKWEKSTYSCEYLVAGQSGDAFLDKFDVIKIKNFNSDSVNIQVGTIQKPKSGKKEDPTQYMMNSEHVTISLGILSSWIKKSWLKPENLENRDQKDYATMEWEHPLGKDKMHNSIFAHYVNNFYSINTVLQAGKKYIDFWESYLWEWRDEQTNRLLAKIPVLTDEQRSALITTQENAEKKRTDEFIEKLEIRDSAESTKMIQWWLLNKNSSEAQKEAALMFMSKKYGVLYEKSALIPYKWTYLWYKAFGGRVGDELFQEYYNEARDQGIQFNEEELIYRLVANQCKNKLKPKRRWKLYKELEAVMWGGRKDETEKWKWDADKKRTFEAREDFAIDELADGWWPNAIGAMESLLNKWADGDVWSLNAIPFVMMTSWAADSFHQQSADQFKNGILPTQFFVGKQTHINIYNNCVRQLCHDVSKEFWWKYTGMWDAMDTLLDNSKNWNPKERVEKSYEFYRKSANGAWGKILWRSLLKLNTRVQDKEARFETWIDDHENIWPYKEYSQIFSAALTNGRETLFKSKEHLEDGFSSEGWVWTGGLSSWDTYEFTREFLKQWTSGAGFREPRLWEMFWNEISSQVDAVSSNSHIDDTHKRKRIGNILKWLMDGLVSSYGQRSTWFKEIAENKRSVFYTKFQQWWVEEADWNTGWKWFRNGGWDESINKYVNNILSWNTSQPSITGNVYSLDDVSSSIKAQASNSLNFSSDEDYLQNVA